MIMQEESEFTSRTGNIDSTVSKVYTFIADMRNLRQMLPEEEMAGWQATPDACTFETMPFGHARFVIVGRKPEHEIRFEGSAFGNITVRLLIQFRELKPGVTGFRLILRSHLNPFYRMLATEPVNDFLEKVVDKMEAFNGY